MPQKLPSNEVNCIVDSVLSLLHIMEYKNTYVSELNRGLLRLLSLCEELTGDPMLLLIDEPISGLSNRESALLMGALRELVNQDRTVLATVYQVSSIKSLLLFYLICVAIGAPNSFRLIRQSYFIITWDRHLLWSCRTCSAIFFMLSRISSNIGQV